jgi:hypothetical protein
MRAGEWYDFKYRDFVLPIGTESDGRGAERFVFNHPTIRDAKNDRPKRFRRDSRAIIEMEARKVIDEILDDQVRLFRKEFQALTERGDRLHRMEQQAAPLSLPLETFIDRAVRLSKQLPKGVVLTDILQRAIDDLEGAQSPTRPVAPSRSLDSGTQGNKAAKTSPISTSAVPSPPQAPASERSRPTAQGIVAAEAAGAVSDEVAGARGFGPQPSAQTGSLPGAVPVGASRKRRSRMSIQWPSKPDLLKMLWTKRGTQIGRELHCDADTVFSMAEELGLPRPESTHWLTRKYGDTVEIPDPIKNLIARLRQEAQATSLAAPSVRREETAPKN